MGRKIIAVVLAVVLSFSLCVPAYAAASPSPSGGGGHSSGGGAGRLDWFETNKDSLSDWWNSIFSADNPEAAYQAALVPAGSGNLPFYLSLKKINADGSYIFSIIGDYSSHCQNSGSNSDYSFCFYSDGFSISTINASSPMNSFITDGTAGMIVPFDGIYYYGFSLNCSLIGNDPYVEGGILGGTYYAYTKDYNNYTAFNPNGTTVLVSGGLPILPTFIIKFCGRSCTGVISILPLVKGVPSSTFVPSVSSAGSIIGDVYATNDDGTTTVYKNCKFVDEENHLFFLPFTNTWVPYTGFTYDYSNFTFNFTTDSGNTSITYGDEYITQSVTDNSVTNIYNYYYSIDSGGGGTSGDDTVPSSGWDWLKNLFGDGLSGILSGLGAGLKKIIEALSDLVARFIAAIGDLLADIADVFMEIVGWLADVLESIFAAVTDGFASFFSFIWQDAYTDFSSA